MCGICGMLELSGEGLSPDDVGRVGEMCDALRHRGPDGEGVSVDGPAALGNRRLAIIDPAGGAQPIYNEDRSVCVVYNGEIYNEPKLRRELQARGHRFSTGTDTEVLAHLYEEDGPDMVSRLEGMFAFALWDARMRRLLLVRDRMGIKPLYYFHDGRTLVFSSELRSLLRHPAVPRQLDAEAVRDLLTFEYVPPPRTVLRGVRKLRPAELLSASSSGVKIRTWWSLPREPEALPVSDEADLEGLVRYRLRSAVRSHLRSDVPLGVLLSGGIDSSVMLGLAAQLGGRPLRTFSVGFREDPTFDESEHAAAVARHFGARHQAVFLEDGEPERLIPEVVRGLDEPLADASVVPTSVVCRLASQHVKVVLSGDGGDETFGGYNTYQAHRIASWLRWLPSAAVRAMRMAADLLPAGEGNLPLEFKLKKFLLGLDAPEQRAVFLWMGAWPPSRQREIFCREVWEEVGEMDPLQAVDEFAGRLGGGGLRRVGALDLRFYLGEGLLSKVDRMSMTHSLEVRVPFLDRAVVELADRLPDRARVRGLETKRLLRRALRGLLPDSILARPKKGFDIPLDRWLRGRLRDYVGDTLSPSSLRRVGLFDPLAVGRLLDRHQARRYNHRQQIWPLVVLHDWVEQHLGAVTSE